MSYPLSVCTQHTIDVPRNTQNKEYLSAPINSQFHSITQNFIKTIQSMFAYKIYHFYHAFGACIISNNIVQIKPLLSEYSLLSTSYYYRSNFRADLNGGNQNFEESNSVTSKAIFLGLRAQCDSVNWVVRYRFTGSPSSTKFFVLCCVVLYCIAQNLYT